MRGDNQTPQVGIFKLTLSSVHCVCGHPKLTDTSAQPAHANLMHAVMPKFRRASKQMALFYAVLGWTREGGRERASERANIIDLVLVTVLEN